MTNNEIIKKHEISFHNFIFKINAIIDLVETALHKHQYDNILLQPN